MTTRSITPSLVFTKNDSVYLFLHVFLFVAIFVKPLKNPVKAVCEYIIFVDLRICDQMKNIVIIINNLIEGK